MTAVPPTPPRSLDPIEAAICLAGMNLNPETVREVERLLISLMPQPILDSAARAVAARRAATATHEVVAKLLNGGKP